MNIALIAHDQKKDDMIRFVKMYRDIFKDHTLFGTGTTGQRIIDETGLNVTRFKSGPLGGDQQIGALVAEGKMNVVIFFRDPLTSQPHEPDVNALLRLCDVYNVPLATNVVSATVMMADIANGIKIFKDLF